MSTLREFSEVTASSATDAVRLYFEPIAKVRAFRPFFNHSGAGLSRLGRVSLVSASAALILATVWARSEVGIFITDLGGKPYISIQEPANSSTAPLIQTVAGRVSWPDRNVWVLVRPVKTATYFAVRVRVDSNGRWSVRVFLESQGTTSGEEFEIRAIVWPKDVRPPEAPTLQQLPEGAVISSPVFVRRQ
jgi:hypothetical protein